MNSKLAGLVLVFSALSGCATSSNSYAPPVSATQVKNSGLINQPFDAVWDQLVRELSSDFFVINNIDKNSRLINVSFSSTHPSDLIDCGRTTRSFKNLRGDQNITYDTAGSATYALTDNRGIAYHVARSTKLEGRANIYVAPDSNGTTVSINAKYVLDITQSTVRFDGVPGPMSKVTIDFSTKSPSGAGNDGVVCQSRGVIERKILSFT